MNLVVYKVSFVFFFLVSQLGYSQTSIFGNIVDKKTQKELIGVQVMIDDTSSMEGTITDNFGTFDLTTQKEPPFYLKFSILGYEEKTLFIEEKDQYLKVTLSQIGKKGETVIVESEKREGLIFAASKIFEDKRESTLATDKLYLLDLYNAPSANYFQQVANFREAQSTIGSLSIQSINTRGFTGIQNWRFVQYLDGVELSPGLGFSLSDFNRASFLDIRDIEVVPGPSSALYGPNSFNGLLSTYTKNPFDYPGISVYTSAGITQQSQSGTNPFVESGIRLAQALNDQWAIKLNLSYLNAQDWEGDSEEFHVLPAQLSMQEELLGRPRSHPNFDAIHVYGDEISVPVDLSGTGDRTLVNRSGFQESALVDYGIENYKVHAGVFYKPLPSLVASYQLLFSEGDGIFRHGPIFPLSNTQNLINRIGLEGRRFSFLAYHNQQNTRDAYQLSGLGDFIQQELKPNEEWARDYGLAYQGTIPGVNAEDHEAARAFADRDIPDFESRSFQDLVSQSRSNFDYTEGGSRFSDQSGMLHLQGTYRLDSIWEWGDFQAGASYRSHSIDSEGQFYNDGRSGFDGPIRVSDLGVYAQASKALLQDQLTLRAGVRMDKNKNFSARISPRISARYSIDPNKEHNIRFSVQQGYRNPSPMEGYLAKDFGNTFFLGGIQENIENFVFMTGDQSSVSGQEIYDSFVTLASYESFIEEGGNAEEVFQAQNLEFLNQEVISSFELGYWGQIMPNLLVEANVFYNQYQDMVSLVHTYSPLMDRIFAVYSNVDEQITSLGVNLSGKMQLPGRYQASLGFTYASSNIDDSTEEYPNVITGFNMPQSQLKLGIGNPAFLNQLGFNATYRWQNAFTWQTPFGVGEVEGYGVLDLALLYNVPDLNLRFKLGGSNLLGTQYQSFYGGPTIGSQYFFTFIFDSY